MRKTTKKPTATAKKPTAKPTAKKSAAKSPAKKPSYKLKAKPAPKAKAKPKTKAKPLATKTTAPRKSAAPTQKQQHGGPTGSNVLWKFLEQKNAKRKQLEESQQNQTGHRGPGHSQTAPKHQGFARFAGPRRRAA